MIRVGDMRDAHTRCAYVTRMRYARVRWVFALQELQEQLKMVREMSEDIRVSISGGVRGSNTRPTTRAQTAEAHVRANSRPRTSAESKNQQGGKTQQGGKKAPILRQQYLPPDDVSDDIGPLSASKSANAAGDLAGWDGKEHSKEKAWQARAKSNRTHMQIASTC